MADALRDAAAADLPALLAIERASNPSPWSEALLASELARAGSRLRVLERDGVPLGFCCTWRVGDELHVLELAVDPACRRQGLGRRLLADAEEWARGAGAVASLLEVRSRNAPAIALYAAAGYAVVGRRPRYYRDDGDDALLMTREFR